MNASPTKGFVLLFTSRSPFHPRHHFIHPEQAEDWRMVDRGTGEIFKHTK
jgi:hypothetical protein